jgi:hypothetical protein
VGSQAEYDLHTANNGNNTGRAGNGIVLNWDDRSLADIGIPGRISRFQLSMANIAEGDDGRSSFTDRKDFNVFLGIDPFSRLKSFWLQGLHFEGAAWFCNVDNRADENGCSRYRIRDNSRAGRQTLSIPAQILSARVSIRPLRRVLAGRLGLTVCAPWATFSAAKTVGRPSDEPLRPVKNGPIVGSSVTICSSGAQRVS